MNIGAKTWFSPFYRNSSFINDFPLAFSKQFLFSPFLKKNFSLFTKEDLEEDGIFLPLWHYQKQ
jgi:hypothetical protein